MAYTLTKEVYEGKLKSFELYVPHAGELQETYQQLLAAGSAMDFPYWGKVWPAAIALSNYIDANPGLFKNKIILELAGGLGLPAMVAAQYAQKVTGSDYHKEAVGLMQQNIALNAISNMQSSVIDWRKLPHPFPYQVVLLSDINYDPGMFDELFDLLTGLQANGVFILLATPQRLLAKPFVERLHPHCRNQEVLVVAGEPIMILKL